MPRTSNSWDIAYWLNADLAYEHRFDKGFTLRGHTGVGINLNPVERLVHVECENVVGLPSPPHFPHWLPYLGMSFGYAFDH